MSMMTTHHHYLLPPPHPYPVSPPPLIVHIVKFVLMPYHMMNISALLSSFDGAYFTNDMRHCYIIYTIYLGFLINFLLFKVVLSLSHFTNKQSTASTSSTTEMMITGFLSSITGKIWVLLMNIYIFLV